MFTALAASVRAADWKGELMTYLNARKADQAGALVFLEKTRPMLEGDDLQSALALLPFLAAKTGNFMKEQDGIVDYFERYKGNDADLTFLDMATFQDYLVFLFKWKTSYPLITEVNFLNSGLASSSAFPSHVELGLKVEKDMLYRVALGDVVIEGGSWKSGFHILNIPVADLFERSGSYDLILYLRSGDYVVRKPIRLTVDIKASERAGGTSAPVQSAFPVIRKKDDKPSAAPAGSMIDMEGEISLYIDNKLVMSSRKFTPKSPPIVIPLGGPQMQGQKPYLPPPRTDVMANSVSILDAIALAYKAFKDLIRRKPEKAMVFTPSYQKVTSLAYSYSKEAVEGRISIVRAILTLSMPGAAIVRE